MIQMCPKCNGDGIIPANRLSSSVTIICPVCSGAMVLETFGEAAAREDEAIRFAEWISYVNLNGIDDDPNLKIILCDGEYYWESDKDGDQPITEKRLYALYKKQNP